MKTCTVTGSECLRQGCRQYIDDDSVTYCKVMWLRSKAIKLEGLADLITSTVKLTELPRKIV